MDLEWDALRDKLDYATDDAAERAVPAPGDGHVRGGGARRRSSSRCSAPTRACGRRTIRTPTARSPTRWTRSRRRSGRCPRRDRRKITATNCAAAVRLRAWLLSRSRHRRLRPRVAPDAATPTRWSRSTARSASTSRSSQRRVGVRRRPDDQLPPPRDLATRGLHAARAERRRRAATSASCGTEPPKRCTTRLDGAGAEIDEGPGRARGRRRRRRRSSVYVRDPDGNLLEFMIYPEGTQMPLTSSSAAGPSSTAPARPGVRRRRRDHRRRHHARSAPDLHGRARARRVGLRGHARLHRHPHALRRAGVLGPGAAAVVVPRRHHGRRRQLRLHDRADPARAPRRDRAHARERRGHGPRDADRRHRVGLRDVPRVPRRRSAGAARCSTSPRTSGTPRCGST